MRAEIKTQMCSLASWVDVNQSKLETSQERLEAWLWEMKTCQEVVEALVEKEEASQEKIEAMVERYEGVPHAGATLLLASLQDRTCSVLQGAPKGAMCKTYRGN